MNLRIASSTVKTKINQAKTVTQKKIKKKIKIQDVLMLNLLTRCLHTKLS